MIIDQIENAYRYSCLHPAFGKAFDFLKNALEAGINPGRYEIDGDRLFVMVAENNGRSHAAAPLEAHRNYIDIQFTLKGNEEIGWLPTNTCKSISEPYDNSRDIEFFADTPNTWLAVPTGSFAIFYPEDAHAPLAGQGSVLKAVVKVRV
ncbi:MAG: YhcH/YjgK/YiaL family protein [Armatimonadota bacterium]|nr:YhcH/YjgK/YiaL family protein [bacterium]